jgi:ribosomal protein S18 acetylase RimI-like enzyme
VELRDYEPADREAVLRLNLDALETDAGRDAAAVIDEFFPELRDIPSAYQQTGAFVVGVEDGAIVAMGGVQRLDDETFEIMRMRVAITQRGRGYGRELLQELEKRARDRGARRLVLETATDLAAANHLYESEGYVETHRTRGDYSIGSVEIVHYEKRLAAFTIRDFEPSDTDVVLELNVRALNPTRSLEIGAQMYPDLLDIAANFDAGCFVVGVVEGQVVAMGGIQRLDAETYEIVRMRVAVAHHRRGYARQIVQELERRATALGARRLVLETSSRLLPAQALYESQGFVETARRDVELLIGPTVLIRYEKRL